MNITDVDDKIILKARRNHLLSQFFASPPPPADVLDSVRHGILSTTTKLQVRNGGNSPLLQHNICDDDVHSRYRASWIS
jgi:cysteinyl-tRNA synthetase